MKRNFRILIFFILTVLLSSGIVYSQTIFWEPVKLPLITSKISAFTIANNGDIWATTVGYDPGVFLSTDNGDTWIQKNKDHLPTVDLYLNDSTIITVIPNVEGNLRINPVTGSIFAGTVYGLLRSTDYGESWTRLVNDYFTDKHTVYDMLVTPSGEIYVETSLLGTTEVNVFYSNNDGNTWVKKSHNGLPVDLWFHLALGFDGTLYAGTLGRGVYRSTDGGDNWLPPSNYTDVTVKNLTICDDDLIFAATEYINFTTSISIIKSTDKGVTWDTLDTGLGIGLSIETDLGDYHPYFTAIQQIIYNPITKHLFIADPINGLYRSTDLGEKWYRVQNTLPTTTTNGTISGYNNIMALVVNPITGMLFTTLHTTYNTNNMYRSTSDIASVISVDVAPHESIDFGTIQYNSHIDTVLCITNKGVTDIVITDVKIIGDDASSFLNTFSDTVTIKPNETQKLSVRFNPKTEGTKDAILGIVADIGDILINLSGNSIAQAISVEEPKEIPTTYSLSQNYPNPFNPTTTIQYTIPKDEFVKLAVYDITGRVVKELVSGHKTAGKYSVEFNASSYSSGTYYYKIEAGEYKNIQKMMLVK